MLRKFKIHKQIKNIKPGGIIYLKCVKHKGECVPTDLGWFRVFKDSKIDKCIEDITIEGKKIRIEKVVDEKKPTELTEMKKINKKLKEKQKKD